MYPLWQKQQGWDGKNVISLAKYERAPLNHVCNIESFTSLWKQNSEYIKAVVAKILKYLKR